MDEKAERGSDPPCKHWGNPRAPFQPLYFCHSRDLCPFVPLQDRLSRCTLHCSDRAKDALEAGGGETRARSQLDACVAACGDEHLRLVPGMAKRMRDGLAALQH